MDIMIRMRIMMGFNKEQFASLTEFGSIFTEEGSCARLLEAEAASQRLWSLRVHLTALDRLARAQTTHRKKDLTSVRRKVTN